MKFYLFSIILFLTAGQALAQNDQDKVIFKAMQDEIDRNKQELALPGVEKPFFIEYIVSRSSSLQISGALGSITNSEYKPISCIGGVGVQLGDYNRTSNARYNGAVEEVAIPAEVNYDLIRRNFWLGTDIAYKKASKEMANKLSFLKTTTLTEEEQALTDLIKIEPQTKFLENKNKLAFDQAAWEKNVRELSGIFKNYPELVNSAVNFAAYDFNIYLKTTEGTAVKSPLSYANLEATAEALTADGVRISDTFSVIASNEKGLPSMKELVEKINTFAKNLTALRNAEEVNEYYSGPVLFEDGAVAKIFTDNLLTQSGLFAFRKPEDMMARARNKSTSIEGRIGKKIIDSKLTVKNYSSLDKYNNKQLSGAYEIDAEGVVPAKETVLVENGILKTMLNNRTPSLKIKQTTGSSRFVPTDQQVARVIAPGTIHIAVNGGQKPEEMKKMLLAAAKEEGLDYAYIVKKFGSSSARMFKIDVKDGKETLVRTGEVTPITLQKIKRTLAISAKENVSNYVLNESVLSSLICPSALLIEDVEINKAETKKVKQPAVTFPLARK